MFNFASLSRGYNVNRVTCGSTGNDFDTHRTLYAGPDPSDPNRILIRKVFTPNDRGTWCFEETTITPRGEKAPSVHSTVLRIGNHYDLAKEDVTRDEANFRAKYRATPNLLAFSVYYRKLMSGANHFSIVENSLNKEAGTTWLNSFRDWRDKRDISQYLRRRWSNN